MNHVQKTRLANLLIENEKMMDQQKVAIFGFSYKKNTSDTRCTPAATIVARLLEKGFKVAIHDPKVTKVGFELEMVA